MQDLDEKELQKMLLPLVSEYIEEQKKELKEPFKFTTWDKPVKFKKAITGKMIDEVLGIVEEMKKDPKDKMKQVYCNIKIFKIFVDDKQLPTNVKEDFESEPESEWWMEQDYYKIQLKVQFFRGRAGV